MEKAEAWLGFGRIAVLTSWRSRTSLAGTVVAASLATTAMLSTDAKAVTVEVAKKCNALMAKEYPPRSPGNPAAGSAKGNGKTQREYFQKCVDNGGNMDGSSDKK